MASKKNNWKKGRGKLGLLTPLLGAWTAHADTPMGKLACTRILEPVLGGNYIRLTAEWKLPKGVYTETAMIGIKDGGIFSWSFTSDGKNTQAILADGTDVHPDAICFEAQMPAGLARMIYWPHETEGFWWAVESKTKKGWNRFTLHHYTPVKK